MEASQRPILDIADRPRPGLWALLSTQHLFAMFGATVLVPLLTGLSPAVGLVPSGCGLAAERRPGPGIGRPHLDESLAGHLDPRQGRGGGGGTGNRCLDQRFVDRLQASRFENDGHIRPGRAEPGMCPVEHRGPGGPIVVRTQYELVEARIVERRTVVATDDKILIDDDAQTEGRHLHRRDAADCQGPVRRGRQRPASCRHIGHRDPPGLGLVFDPNHVARQEAPRVGPEDEILEPRMSVKAVAGRCRELVPLENTPHLAKFSLAVAQQGDTVETGLLREIVDFAPAGGEKALQRPALDRRPARRRRLLGHHAHRAQTFRDPGQNAIGNLKQGRTFAAPLP
jgi:hypothetical protein